MYTCRWKYTLSFFNIVAFMIHALLVPCDKVLVSITVELFQQVTHNGTCLVINLSRVEKCFPPNSVFTQGKTWNRMSPNWDNAPGGQIHIPFEILEQKLKGTSHLGFGGQSFQKFHTHFQFSRVFFYELLIVYWTCAHQCGLPSVTH